MKLKLFIFSLLWLSLFVKAQEKESVLPKDYTVAMDSLLLHINKDQINTGLLYDRVVNNAHLLDFNDPKAPMKSNMWHFIQALSEVHHSSLDPKNKMCYELVDDLIRKKDNVIEIGFINTPINYIDYGTQEKPNVIFKDGYLYNNDTINPFKQKRITIVAALKEVVQRGEVKIKLNPYFTYQDDLNSIKNLTAIINDTKIELVKDFKNSEEITTLKLEGQVKEIIYNVEFADATTLQTSSTITVNTPQASTSGDCLAENFVGSAGIDRNSPENTIPFQGYNETSPIKGVLEYRTYYNKITNQCGNPLKIRKPIIILDGFDPGDTRKIYPGSDGYTQDHQSLYELMSYDSDNNPLTDNNINLVDKLTSNAPGCGFDVTLVNFPENKIIDPENPTQQVWVQTGVITHQIHIPLTHMTITWYENIGQYVTIPRYKHLADGGADYIERNAMAVVALLQRENTKLAANGSTEQITLVGPSMGGLISRYALAYMEKNNIPHNVKLWVSFDSPHLGANIPLSGQENIYFFGYYGQKDQAKQKFHENFASPAARQMLIEQLDYKQQEYNWQDNQYFWAGGNGQNNNTPFREHFMSNLTNNGLPNSNGFPTNVRKIAVINGTTNGTKTNSEGQLCLELAGFLPSWLKVVAIKDRNLSSYGSFSETFSGLVTNTTTAHVLPSNPFFNPSFLSSITFINTTINRSNTNPRGSMDIVQGGTYRTFDIIKDEFQPELDDAGVSSDWRTNLHKHAFIPSVSSLAFINPEFDWSTPLNRNLICDPANKEIPFDSYFSPSENQDHVFLTNDSQKWLLNEFNGIDQAPNFSIAQDAFLSSNTSVSICDGQTNTYTISDVCKVPSPVANWSVQGNLQIVSSTPYSITVVATSDDPNDGTITATFQNDQTYTISIHIGSPKTLYTSINNAWDWVCINSGTFQMSVPPVPSATSYYWTAEADISEFSMMCPTINAHHGVFVGGSTSGNISSITTTSPNATINWGNCLGTYILSCYAVNDCGMTLYSETYTTVGKPQSNPCTHKPFDIKIAPNPIESGYTNFVVSKTINSLPCNYAKIAEGYKPKTYLYYEKSSTFVSIYDFSSNLVYSNVFPNPDYVEVKELPKEDETNPDEVKKYEELNYYNIQNLDLKPGFYFIKIKDSDDDTSDGVTTQIEVK